MIAIDTNVLVYAHREDSPFAGTVSRLASLRLRLRDEHPKTRKRRWVQCITGRGRQLVRNAG